MQHDDHCVITFMGMNWRIVAKHRHLIYLRGRDYNDFDVETCLDTSTVRWDEYVEMAVQWMTPGNVRRL